MARRLSGLDAAFLYAETPTMHMHAGALTILDPSTAANGYDVDSVRAMIADRVDRLAPFRMRLASPPFGIDRPVWVDDHDIDVRRHIRPIAVPRPGTPRQVADLAARMLTTPLPRDLPLWQMWFVEGLEHDRVALIWKVHHALLGGTQAMRVFELLFDADPDSGPAADQAANEHPAGEHPPSPLAVVGHAALSLAGTPLLLGLAAGTGAVAAARLTALLLTGRRTGAGSLLPFVAPASCLNGALVAARSCAWSSISLADVKTVKDARGVTVNDVVLAVCGGALRHYLEERGELPDRTLTASVPVGVTTPDGDAASVLGNTTSVFGATLATDVADPLQRLRRVHEATSTAKAMHRALGSEMILHLAGAFPPGMFRVAAQGWSASGLPARMVPPFNVVMSNMRGPATKLYSGGAELLACHLFGPLLEAISLNITVMSYRDSIDVGVVSSPNLVTDPWPIAEAMPRALDELLSAT